MDFRRFLRGHLPQGELKRVGAEVSRRYGESLNSIETLDADNWLSVPCVVNEQWFVKILTDQHTIVHAILTAGRNIGMFSAGTEGFFERFETPLEMAKHELKATRRMVELGIPAPKPLEAFEYDEYGILVLEYLPNFKTLDEVKSDTATEFAPILFEQLALMHSAGLAHGDLRAENVLIAKANTSEYPPDRCVDGDVLYFIDATRVDMGAIEDARAYDLACALGALSPKIGVKQTVTAAATNYSNADLIAARDFLDFVKLRPDHDFDSELIKGEIETLTA